MDLDFDIDQECTHTHFYTKTVKDSKELCLVCMVGEDEQWDRYMTKCKHVSLGVSYTSHIRFASCIVSCGSQPLTWICDRSFYTSFLFLSCL